MTQHLQKALLNSLTTTISETNGITLDDTLELILTSELQNQDDQAWSQVKEFKELLDLFKTDKITINALLTHPFTKALFNFFKRFPLKYQEEHCHLTGALTASFLYPRIKVLLDGPHKAVYEAKIREVYGESAIPIQSVEDVENLITLKENEGFLQYLKILYLPKLVFTSRQAHTDAALHMAEELYSKFNVGRLRLKFSVSRATSSSSEQIPYMDDVSVEDVILGLYDGFHQFQKTHPDFNFILSPVFRKEANFFDSHKFKTRRDHFMSQINEIVDLIDDHPFLREHLTDADTVGDERDLYRKSSFNELQRGFRKLQDRGIKIRSHHGETWHTLQKGIQAVDNAMNIWHIDTLEHGLSLGINPNAYFHRLYQEAMRKNRRKIPVTPKDKEYGELFELDWGESRSVFNKLLGGEPLTDEEQVLFVKTKFHTAREVESYQHDVLNRMIQKGVTLVSLPSSNNKLTGRFDNYKDHPFSWWEKKGVQLGVGTDNYITLNTNFILEMIILLYTDPEALKITKLLMVTTGELRRPYISHLLWKMRKEILLEK